MFFLVRKLFIAIAYPVTKEVREMAKAYLKIKVEMGRERAVRDALLTFEEVKAAEVTTGDQDVLALVEADSYDDILQVVIDRLRTIKGVTGTTTDLVLE
ncbi:Lrp/AsnC family transcriptional regulator [Candidatus Aerophobetes bacterium]|uniref:Lrp/AsnC family transcriptional regulator n=1 Tax=Aerophobetes bacterium TaxID=2030807 RepID=A0A523T9S6_UNCAE|nr:MAG: Lrp/AsnC family transcriptional regulator [Candidatus Aerophobetes bacterium]